MQETGEFQHPQFLLERPCLYLSSVHEINIYIYIINLPPPYSYCCVPQTTSLLFQQFAAVNALKRVPQSVLSQQLWAVEIATWLWIQDPFCSVFSFYFYSLLEQRLRVEWQMLMLESFSTLTRTWARWAPYASKWQLRISMELTGIIQLGWCFTPEIPWVMLLTLLLQVSQDVKTVIFYLYSPLWFYFPQKM